MNPRTLPRPGDPVYLAEDERITRALSRKMPGNVGAIHIGSLLNREAGRVPIALDAGAIASTHLAVLASTGAGKSYMAGVLVEELMAPWNRAAVLILDPHSEYETLSELAHAPELEGPDGYRPQVRILRPDQIHVRVGTLEFPDLLHLLPDTSERMGYVLSQAYQSVRRKSQKDFSDPTRWTRQQLLDAVEEAGEAKKDDYGTAGALLWRLRSVLGHSKFFSDTAHLSLQEMFRPGQCTVILLSEIDERAQQTLCATLMRRLFRARKATDKKEVGETSEHYLPYPVFTLIEEAHTFCPANANAVSTRVLKQILGEGRKFGIGVGLVSQRPGKLDPDVLSQCNTQFILRVVNNVDQARIAEAVETMGRDLMRELPALTKGQAIVAGHGINATSLVQVRKRFTTHGGESRDAPSDWLKFFESSRVEERRRASALPASLSAAGSIEDDLFGD